MNRWMIATVLFLASCSEKTVQSRIMDADRVEIVDIESKFSYTDTTQAVRNEFSRIAGFPGTETKCEPQGRLLFKKDNKVILDAGYYKDATDCAFLIIDENGKRTGYKLSYNSLVFLGVYFQKMKRQYLERNHSNQ